MSRVLPCRPGRHGFSLLEMILVVTILALVVTLISPSLLTTRNTAEQITAQASMKAIREAIVGSEGRPGYLEDMRRVPGFSFASLRLGDLLAPLTDAAQIPFDPASGRGWRGPYIRNVASVRNTHLDRMGMFPSAGDRRFEEDLTFLDRGFFVAAHPAAYSPYALPGDPALADPWGNPLILQMPNETAFSRPVTEEERFRYARIVSAGPDGILQSPPDVLAGRGAEEALSLRGDDLVLFLNRADVYEEPTP